MATPKGYSSYRGKMPRWKIFVIILLIVVILAAVGFLVMQKYLVYDGSGIPHFQIPGKEKTEETSKTDKKSKVVSSKSKEDLNIKIHDTKTKSITALQVSETPLTDWQTLQSHLTASGISCNSVVVTLKDQNGHVYYNFDAAASESRYAVKTNSGTAAAISGLTASKYTAVARLSCLRDPIVSRADLDGKGLKNTGGYIFYDGNNDNWMDPSKTGTQEYLAALAKECANLGFKEILLTDFTYPTVGKLSKIDYGSGLKSDNLKACLTAIQTALKGTGVKLSVELPADVITSGSDTTAGLNLTDIAPMVDRIYAQTTAANVETLSAAVSAASKSTSFVPEFSGTPSGSNYLVLSSR